MSVQIKKAPSAFRIFLKIESLHKNFLKVRKNLLKVLSLVHRFYGANFISQWTITSFKKTSKFFLVNNIILV